VAEPERSRHDEEVPRAVTVWAVELGKDVHPDEIKGTLELGNQALLFSPNDEARPAIRIALHDIAKVRRLRGSPVLMVERTTSAGSRKTAFYFAQPPPLAVLMGGSVEQPVGFDRFRSPKRKARRDNVGYLGLMNREKKAALSEWVRAVKDAVSKTASGPDQAAAPS
jgi:hypothetical protein